MYKSQTREECSHENATDSNLNSEKPDSLLQLVLYHMVSVNDNKSKKPSLKQHLIDKTFI